MSWKCVKQVTSGDTDEIETRPSGDGTFQKWISLHTDVSNAAGCTCVVKHDGLKVDLNINLGKNINNYVMRYRGKCFLITVVYCNVHVFL